MREKINGLWIFLIDDDIRKKLLNEFRELKAEIPCTINKTNKGDSIYPIVGYGRGEDAIRYGEPNNFNSRDNNTFELYHKWDNMSQGYFTVYPTDIITCSGSMRKEYSHQLLDIIKRSMREERFSKLLD